MKNALQLFVFCLLFSLGTAASAQSDTDFNNCSAIFLNGKMLVDQYTPEGKCTVKLDATGKITLHPVELFPDGSAIPGKKIRFKVAIHGKPGDSIVMYSDKTYTELDIAKVLSVCRKGESIMVLTLEREWAVPHHEIFIE